MDTSVYIFVIILDVFISFTIFAIYFYVLFKYFLHIIEENSIVKMFNTHLEFYKPLITLSKLYSKTNVNNTIKNLQDNIANVNDTIAHIDFSIGTYIIIGSILFLLLILIIYFAIYYKKIIQQVELNPILFTIFVNFIMIIGFELLFVFFVYGNIDICNIQKILNI